MWPAFRGKKLVVCVFTLALAGNSFAQETPPATSKGASPATIGAEQAAGFKQGAAESVGAQGNAPETELTE